VSSAYSGWMGQTVVLQLATFDLRVPISGVIVGETGDALKVRIGDKWDVDIFKSMVLAVEEDRHAELATFSFPAQL
jgi:hypothetical protein